jgi:hypothetical protein
MQGIIVNFIGKGGTKNGMVEYRLPEYGNKLFNGAIFPKFLAYLDPADGYPVMLPVFQARAVEYKRIVFPLAQFKTDLTSETFVSVSNCDFSYACSLRYVLLRFLLIILQAGNVKRRSS